MFSHDFLVLNYRLEIRTADCRLEDMTANHTQPSTSYPCEDYDTTENVGLLEELQKVNNLYINFIYSFVAEAHYGNRKSSIKRPPLK